MSRGPGHPGAADPSAPQTLQGKVWLLQISSASPVARTFDQTWKKLSSFQWEQQVAAGRNRFDRTVARVTPFPSPLYEA
ncbi:MAG: hypothetical protein L6W00_15980 [Lentisphaeria bacterium]|nr:MAG: hypothetical protein L6W00_15980 [Lentisphaeria bacterium]